MNPLVMHSLARFGRIASAILVTAAATWAALHRDQLDPAAIEATLRGLGAWAPFAFIALYALGVVAFVPASIFTLAGGALFGPVLGLAVNLTGAAIGATAAFFIARTLAASWVRRKAGPRVARLIAGVDAEGWRFVAFTRLVPLFPFSLLNYALGLTRIDPPRYVLTSIVCMTPGALAYTWLGFSGRKALTGDAASIRYGLIALALLAATAFLPRLVRRLRREEPKTPRWIERDALAAALGAGAAITVIDVRGEDEFAGPLGHIAGARNMPVNALSRQATALAPIRARTIVLVCKTDRRSTAAAAILAEEGFQDVQVLREGMVGWNEAGLPVE